MKTIRLQAPAAQRKCAPPISAYMSDAKHNEGF